MLEQKKIGAAAKGKKARELKLITSSGYKTTEYGPLIILDESLCRVEYIGSDGYRHVIFNDGGTIIICYDEEDDGT